MKNNTNESEIINQKKQFIFKATQTSDYVFPDESYTYYIYIKNVSGSDLENFTIKIVNSPAIIFKDTKEEPEKITIESNGIRLYKFDVYCSSYGEHTVHFIGYGEGTQVLYQTLKINCTRTYNSNKLLHRIHFYDFTPYEDIYSMEASDYNNQTTELTKRQKLPEASHQLPPNPNNKPPFILEKDFVPENVESESYLKQYDILKNTRNHVYQYISRETFIEDSMESYTGENLYEIFEKINKKSKYFRGKLFRTGTNTLLNDFRQYTPNGFIYRMGLLNSEIYQYLGVIPTYDYMSDKLFRWAPSKYQLLSIHPEKKAMKWGENVWAGKGWIVYKTVTPEYMKTTEYINKKENHAIKNTQLLSSFEDKESATTFIEKNIRQDEIDRQREQSDIIKYEYYMKESLYEPGVFFINIPVDKIPSNFYLLSHENLSAIINRAKPYGTKPIINYIIEKNFNHQIDMKVSLNYHEYTTFDTPFDNVMEYLIAQNSFEYKTITCEGDKKTTYPALIPKEIAMYKNFSYNHDMDIYFDASQLGMKNILDSEMEQEVNHCITEEDYSLSTLEDLFEVLYQNNYEDISFKIDNRNYRRMVIKDTDLPSKKELKFEKDKKGNLSLKGKTKKYGEKIESLKIPLNYISKSNSEYNMTIKDIYGREHKINIHYDKGLNLSSVQYEYINLDKKSFIRKRGYADIYGVCIIFGKINDKRLLIYVLEDKDKKLHYFHHILLQDISSFKTEEIKDNETISNHKNLFYTDDIITSLISFETPFYKKANIYQPTLIKEGNNWSNLYRLNTIENTYTYIQNLGKDYLTPNDIFLYYDYINIPETSKVLKMRLKIFGDNSSNDKTYLETGFNTNYITEEVSGYNLQLEPEDIIVYSHLNESSFYYEAKLDIAKEKNQETYIKKFSELLEENYIFNEDIDVAIPDYMNDPDDFITIDNEFWYELSNFTTLQYKLNEIETINFIIEGYNTEYESKIIVETLSETNHSSPVEEIIPSGYFRKKIPVLYSNQFLLDLLRIRFRFDDLNHNIKIFDTRIELKFKNKQEEDVLYETINEIDLKKKQLVNILTDYYLPANLNNGINIKMSFDDLKPGGYYQINKTELEVIYEDTDIGVMVNNKKYQDVYYGENKSTILGEVEDAYLSGEFYDDVITMNQPEDNVGANNKGIKLQNSLYQLFETRADNITSIEIFPHGFMGNPDETLKLSLYTNRNHTPDKLIKEVYINGWVKTNKELKNLDRIKYNFNVENLIVNEKYWFKLEVINKQQTSYYLLKGINDTKTGFKLLADENNNYINTFSNLKFNIYSKNLSRTFNTIPVLQEKFDNPYILVGLHKGKGTIQKLRTNKTI